MGLSGKLLNMLKVIPECSPAETISLALCLLVTLGSWWQQGF